MLGLGLGVVDLGAHPGGPHLGPSLASTGGPHLGPGQASTGGPHLGPGQASTGGPHLGPGQASTGGTHLGPGQASAGRDNGSCSDGVPGSERQGLPGGMQVAAGLCRSSREGPSCTPAAQGSGDVGRCGRWLVLLDAAKGCATQPPDLSRHPADFVVLSYYKIFGYPCGLGALLVRRDALPLLRRKYFSGGTVAVSVADQDFHHR